MTKEQSMGSVLICRGVSPWAPHLQTCVDRSGAPTEGRPYKLGHFQFMRVIAPTLLAVILVSSVACAGRSQRDDTNRNPAQTNPGQWQPSKSIPGGFRRDLLGDTIKPGPFRYQLKIPAGARVATHQHSKDVHVKVLSGSMFIIIGEPLESNRAQHFTAGSAFVVPAHAWHDEWWDQETIVDAEGVGPMETIYKNQ